MADKRLYQLEYKRTDRPAYVNDIGHLLQISGVLFSGNGENILMFLPDGPDVFAEFYEIRPTLEEWNEIVRASDNPQYYDENSKVWLRKSQRLISGHVQQKIWARDRFHCMFCGRKMGQVQLTVDHWIPLEHGGTNVESNYISACRRCNKDKGSMMPEEYCLEKGYDYQGLQKYLEGNYPITLIRHLIM